MTIQDTIREKKLRKQADNDHNVAEDKVRKAIDLKDPRFLGEAALAATRGPVGLAWFAASKGVEATKQRAEHAASVAADNASELRKEARREPAEYVASTKSASRKARAAAKRELARLRKAERGPLRRYAPLWITGLVGGVAVAGGTAYFLRDKKSSSTAAPATPTTHTADPEGTPAQTMDATAAAAAAQSNSVSSGAPTNMGVSSATAPQPEEGGDTKTP